MWHSEKRSGYFSVTTVSTQRFVVYILLNYSCVMCFYRHRRPHIGDPPPGKMDEKLKSENMQKEQLSMCMLYFESNQGRQV